VTGDIRDIRKLDFPAMESLFLPKSVRGGRYHEFQNISDVPKFMHTIHHLLERSPCLFGDEFFGGDDSPSRAFGWRLSRDSLHWYDGEIGSPPPPFELQFIYAGWRQGWSGCTWRGSYSELHSCEINWLDPEPSSESSDYEYYIGELQDEYQHAIDFYRGHHQPPTEEEYRRLCEVSPP
jgi:hypothetical protein